LILLILGKGLETLGAVILAWIAFRAARMEIKVGRHLNDDSQLSDELKDIQKRLQEARKFRQQQFGLRELLFVGAGTTLIAVGCALYLWALVGEGPSKPSPALTDPPRPTTPAQ
jgi:hypothetical protein